ncbi:hypothetical protein BB561_005256 [Smittium simulii]|uniref:HECT domain-containing protein n=1 Tax=Smittium simulii TaxID=133385 RepID=A0A2T9YBD3_9FUNG|nr:hypothetical protein BB561_005256 [Smittium simulii]
MLDNLKRKELPSHKRVKKRNLASDSILNENLALPSTSSQAFASSIPLSESLKTSTSINLKPLSDSHIDLSDKTVARITSIDPRSDISKKPSTKKKRKRSKKKLPSISSDMNNKQPKRNVNLELDNNLLSDENSYSFDEFDSDISISQDHFYDSWVSFDEPASASFYSSFNKADLLELCSKLQTSTSSTEIIEILKKLSLMLSFATEDCLLASMSTIFSLCQNLLTTITSFENSDITLLAFRIISNLLEIHSSISSSLINNGLLTVLNLQLQNLQDIDIADQALVILELLSSRHSYAVLDSGALLAALNFIDFFTSCSQRAVMQSLYNCTSRVDFSSISNISEIIQIISNSTNASDSKLADISWNCIENIINKISSDDKIELLITPDFLTSITSNFINCADSTRKKKILSILGSIAQKSLKLSLDILQSKVLETIYLSYSEKFVPKNSSLIPKPLDTTLNQNHKDFAHMEPEILILLSGLLPTLLVVVKVRESNRVCYDDFESSERIQAEKCFALDKFFIKNNVSAFQISSLLLSIGITFIKNESFCLSKKILLESVLLGLWMFDIKKLDIINIPEIESFSPWFITRGFDGESSDFIASLLFAYRFLYFADNYVKLSYERQGSVTILQKLASKGSKSGSLDIFSRGVQLLDNYLTSDDNNIISPANYKNISNKRLEDWKKNVSSLIVDSYWTFDKVDTKLATEIGDTLFTLKNNAKEIKALWKRPNLNSNTELLTCVDALTNIISSTQGITAYEFENSSWLETLSMIALSLHSSNPNDPNCKQNKLELFAYTIFDKILSDTKFNEADSYFNNFINMLQEILTSNDTLQINILSSAINHSDDNPLSILTRQIAVDLHYDDKLSSPNEKTSTFKSELELITRIKTELKPLKVSCIATSDIASLKKLLKPHIIQVIQKVQKLSSNTDYIIHEVGSSSFDDLSISSRFNFDEIASNPNDSIKFTNSKNISNKLNDDHENNSEGNKNLINLINEKDSSLHKLKTSTTSSLDPASINIKKFNPFNFSIKFYYTNKFNNNTIELDSSDSIYASFITAYTSKPKKKAGTFNPWSSIFNLQYKIVFETSELEKSEAQNTFSYAKITNHEADQANVGRSFKKKLLHPAFLKLLSKKFGYSLNIINALYMVHKSKIHTKASKYNDSWKRSYHNNRLIQKIQSLIDDPLTISTKAFPDWCFPLVNTYPYLFSFESKNLFMRCFYLPLSRNLTNWKFNHEHPSNDHNDTFNDDNHNMFSLLGISYSISNEIIAHLANIKKQKVLINRSQLFKSAILAINKFASVDNILEVEYTNEVGTGLGPTLEFFSSVCAEIFSISNNMWHNSSYETLVDSKYIISPNGFYPRPIKEDPSSEANKEYSNLFKFLGMFVAKAIVDERPLDLPLHPAFISAIKVSISAERNTEYDYITLLSEIDPQLAKNLVMLQNLIEKEIHIDSKTDNSKQKIKSGAAHSSIEDLCIDFTLPGYQDFELCKNGSEILVNNDNLQQYLDLVCEAFMESGLKIALESFKQGFSNVIPIEFISSYSVSELSIIFGLTETNSEYWRQIEDYSWSYKMIFSNITIDHGYTPDSPVVGMFVTWLSKLSRADRRKFLKFVTGSPRLPLSSMLVNKNIGNGLDLTSSSKTNEKDLESHYKLDSASIIGFGALKPRLTVVLRHSNPPLTPDSYLPTVMTCVNYIKLPNYSSIEILDSRWRQAFEEGCSSFHLS